MPTILPCGRRTSLQDSRALAKHDVPLLHVCGSEDFLLDRYTRVIEDTYRSLGGQITVIVKDGHAHHRHSLQNPKLIADWIEQHRTCRPTANKPRVRGWNVHEDRITTASSRRHIYLKEEDSYCHGPRAGVHGVLRPL